ncbi:putative virion-maturation protease [Drosophila-associated adintovirus 2]|uniref:Virion-maturation protease n=1 Tax=Drosophila-associated adintovirus 2 TaxID=2744817 RepID=A0A7D4VNZ0_9VIRU|nr:putative virion-maturation protease [Drosophila-associated adintovirus 2]
MNTLQIEQILFNNPNTKKIFKGVFAADKLPVKINTHPSIVIANTDSSDKPGTHWVAFYFKNAETAEFFDSYGQYPSNNYFINILKRNSKKFTFNRQQVQGYFSNTCGHYCILFSLFKSKNKTTKYFLNTFKKNDYMYNDKIILRLFNKFKKCKK